MTHAWKKLASGKYIDLNNLKEEDLDIQDVEVALNQIVRFTGHYNKAKPLTVAQHSLLCLLLAERLYPKEPEIHLAALSHDFEEAYVGDVATPIKVAMGDRWSSFLKPIQQVVENKFLPKLDKESERKVKQIDGFALMIEARMMWEELDRDKWPSTQEVYMKPAIKRALFRAVQEEGYVDITSHWEYRRERVRVSQ